jgi:hypothetical protein
MSAIIPEFFRVVKCSAFTNFQMFVSSDDGGEGQAYRLSAQRNVKRTFFGRTGKGVWPVVLHSGALHTVC